jgi:uncharacterized damage-inducible protein DinB
MSKAGMVGMELAARDILSVCETLDEDQWRLPRAASGWSVQDVVVHEACLLGDLIAAVGGEVLRDLKIEALNNIQVDEKRGWASGQVSNSSSGNLTRRWVHSLHCRMNRWPQWKLRC